MAEEIGGGIVEQRRKDDRERKKGEGESKKKEWTHGMRKRGRRIRVEKRVR